VLPLHDLNNQVQVWVVSIDRQHETALRFWAWITNQEFEAVLSESRAAKDPIAQIDEVVFVRL